MSNKPTLQQKGRYGLQYRGNECTNCGHPLDVSDRFCPSCSQANSTKKLTLKDFFDEFFASLISYDSKLLKTLSALLLKPGKITRDYVLGKRVSYTNPFRFLLSLSIVYFLMLNFTGNFQKWDKYGADRETDFLGEFGKMNFSTDGLAELDSTIIKAGDNKELLGVLDSLNLAKEIAKRDSVMIADPAAHLKKLKAKSFLSRFSGKREFFGVLMEKEKVYNFEDIPAEYLIESTRENRSAFNAAGSFLRLQKQPGSFLSTLISKLPFAIFFFLPVFTLFIWLVYIRKKYTYTEHLIFSFHNQSLLFILLIISFLIDSIFDVISGWIFILVFSIYLFLAMRKFYQQGFIKTFAKYVFLNTIFFILAMFAVVLLFTGSAFTY